MNKYIKKISIKYQLILVLIVVSVVPFFLLLNSLSGIFIGETERLNREIFDLNNNITKNTIEIKITDTLSNINIIKSQELLLEMLEEVNKEGFFSNEMKYGSIFLTMDNVIKNSNGLFEIIFLTDSAGNILSNSLDIKLNYQLLSIENKEYFSNLNINKSNYFGNPFISNLSKEIVMPISVAVIEEDEFIGSLVAFINLDKLIEMKGKNSDIKTIVTTNDNWNISHWNKDEILKKSSLKFLGNSISIDGINYIFKKEKIEINKWNIITLINKDSYTKLIRDINKKRTLFTILMIFIFLVILYFSNKNFVLPVKKLSDNLYNLSIGKFFIIEDKSYNFEIYKLNSTYNYFVNNIENLLKNLSDLSIKLSEESIELNNISMDSYESTKIMNNQIELIANDSNKQNSNLNQSLIRINSIMNKINEINDFSQKIRKSFNNQNEITSKGSKLIENINQEIHIGAENSIDLEKKIQELKTSIESINKMNTTIKEVSRRTNILAINASIEASRAGSVGFGFSVVASEIRTLSNQIALETGEINNIIMEVKDKYEMVSEFINNNSELIDKQEIVMLSLTKTYKELESENDENLNMIYKINNLIGSLQMEKDQASNLLRDTSIEIDNISNRSIDLILKSKESFDGINTLNGLVEKLSVQSSAIKSEIEGLLNMKLT